MKGSKLRPTLLSWRLTERWTSIRNGFLWLNICSTKLLIKSKIADFFTDYHFIELLVKCQGGIDSTIPSFDREGRVSPETERGPTEV